MVISQGNLSFFSLWNMKNSLRPTMCLGEQGLKLPKGELCFVKIKYMWNFVQFYFYCMNSDWIAFNYKLVAFLKTFPIIGHKAYIKTNMRRL
jgi:hypothetical protein